METVLVVGASGNIGVSVIIGALRSNRHVLAIVRSKAAGEKVFQHVGSRDNITLVEADVSNEHGVADVVRQVEEGKLPAFQHVYASGM
jgi:NAD(P)-dependent dehydrogenase (short-subunit alcohol dehydrogenase family)